MGGINEAFRHVSRTRLANEVYSRSVLNTVVCDQGQHCAHSMLCW